MSEEDQASQLLRVLLPYPITVFVEEVRGMNLLTDVTIRLEHADAVFRAAQYCARIPYADIYAAHLDGPRQLSFSILQFNQLLGAKALQNIQIRTREAALVLNQLEYRVNVARTWGARL